MNHGFTVKNGNLFLDLQQSPCWATDNNGTASTERYPLNDSKSFI